MAPLSRVRWTRDGTLERISRFELAPIEGEETVIF